MKKILINILLLPLILVLTSFSFTQKTETYTNSIGIEFVCIPAGEFVMGSNSGYNREKPVHRVYVDSYYISKTEITFAQYDAFCNDTGRSKPNDESWRRGKKPVTNVSWSDATAFCKWLSKKTGENIYLPTEAQWEKACLATSTGERYGSCDSIAWYRSNSDDNTQPVAQKQPNSYGLYDMLGNVYEWCSDLYDYNYYSESPLRNPQGPSDGSFRVVRGGGWSSTAFECRASYRGSYLPVFRSYLLGFRIAKSL